MKQEMQNMIMDENHLAQYSRQPPKIYNDSFNQNSVVEFQVTGASNSGY